VETFGLVTTTWRRFTFVRLPALTTELTRRSSLATEGAAVLRRTRSGELRSADGRVSGAAVDLPCHVKYETVNRKVRIGDLGCTVVSTERRSDRGGHDRVAPLTGSRIWPR